MAYMYVFHSHALFAMMCSSGRRLPVDRSWVFLSRHCVDSKVTTYVDFDLFTIKWWIAIKLVGVCRVYYKNLLIHMLAEIESHSIHVLHVMPIWEFTKHYLTAHKFGWIQNFAYIFHITIVNYYDVVEPFTSLGNFLWVISIDAKSGKGLLLTPTLNIRYSVLRNCMLESDEGNFNNNNQQWWVIELSTWRFGVNIRIHKVRDGNQKKTYPCYTQMTLALEPYWIRTCGKLINDLKALIWKLRIAFCDLHRSLFGDQMKKTI